MFQAAASHLWAACPVRMWLSSSPKATSRTQWWAFSLLQCWHTACSRGLALGDRLEMKQRVSVVTRLPQRWVSIHPWSFPTVSP